ncbi:hypothetical protein F9230_07675 [Acinetobacter johnsonii]|uniref:hypothetical protein n=1 Tax=Acinetobacter johnsonii TaxID=40214 RepID=UPI001F3F0BD4|nr:hypothetical protein [Acinetobacter johnsonii]UJA04236.1 hypothetical protein F9230_07675 [Acinetobacter johnsonii]
MSELVLVRPRYLTRKRPSYIKLVGNGYLGGDFPDYVTKVEGIPTQTEILVFLHRESGQPGDGKLIKRLTTFQSGSWRVGRLNSELRYDVICRYPGFKDEIISNVKPHVE